MLTAWSKFRRAQRAFRRAREGDVAITFALAVDPDPRFCRRGRRLQPRQRGEGRPAGGARFHRPDGVEKRRHSRPAARCSNVGAKTTSLRCSTIPQAQEHPIHRELFDQRRIERRRSTARPTCRPPSWPSSASRRSPSPAASTAKWGSTRLRVALVLDNTGSMADNGKIDALQDRDQESADPTAERRHHQWRRLCVDHSLRQGRQCRCRATTIRPGITGSTGPISSRRRPNFDAERRASGPARPAPTATHSNGFTCVTRPGGTTTTFTIPSSGTYQGDICPSNSIGCYDSTPDTRRRRAILYQRSCAAATATPAIAPAPAAASQQGLLADDDDDRLPHTWFVDQDQVERLHHRPRRQSAARFPITTG